MPAGRRRRSITTEPAPVENPNVHRRKKARPTRNPASSPATAEPSPPQQRAASSGGGDPAPVQDGAQDDPEDPRGSNDSESTPGAGADGRRGRKRPGSSNPGGGEDGEDGQDGGEDDGQGDGNSKRQRSAADSAAPTSGDGQEDEAAAEKDADGMAEEPAAEEQKGGAAGAQAADSAADPEAAEKAALKEVCATLMTEVSGDGKAVFVAPREADEGEAYRRARISLLARPEDDVVVRSRALAGALVERLVDSLPSAIRARLHTLFAQHPYTPNPTSVIDAAMAQPRRSPSPPLAPEAGAGSCPRAPPGACYPAAPAHGGGG